MKLLQPLVLFIMLLFCSCGLNEREKSIKNKEAELNERQQALVLWEQQLTQKESALQEREHRLDSTKGKLIRW